MIWCIKTYIIAYVKTHTHKNRYIIHYVKPTAQLFNTLRPRQNGRHFADDIFKWIFVNENIWIPIEISLRFIPRGPINNISALV